MQKNRRANLVLLAGIVFLLSVGVLYAWSVLKIELMIPIEDGGWGWESKEAGLPYTFALICFALSILIGGRIQDRIGPRRVVTAGGVFVGLGLILSGLAGNSVAGVTLCFGLLVGTGIGLGYGSVLPSALKWFHASKRGFVSGLIVGGYGLAPVHIAPLMNSLLSNFDIEKALICLGAASMLITVPMAQLICNPPEGYVPPPPRKARQSAGERIVPHASPDVPWNEMLKTRQFYLLFVMFLTAASVGFMIIGNLTKIARMQIGVDDTAFLALLVSFLAAANTGGRVLGGLLSDRIGRVNALYVVFALQSLNMVGFVFYQSLPALMVGIFVVGFCFGTLFSVLPAVTADLYGLRYCGTNYGVVNLAGGIAGAVVPVTADFIYDAHGNYEMAYILAAIMMALLLGVNYMFKRAIDRRG